MENESMKKNRFYDESAHSQMSTNELHPVTKKHLQWFTDNLGVKFATKADIWLVQRIGYRHYLEVGEKPRNDDTVWREPMQFALKQMQFDPNKEYWKRGSDGCRRAACNMYICRLSRQVKDIRILGTLGPREIEYWIHATKGSMSKTLIYCNNKRSRVTQFEEEWPVNFKGNVNVAKVDKNTLSVLLAHSSKVVRNFAKSLM